MYGSTAIGSIIVKPTFMFKEMVTGRYHEVAAPILRAVGKQHHKAIDGSRAIGREGNYMSDLYMELVPKHRDGFPQCLMTISYNYFFSDYSVQKNQ
jgi:hypothetical protein